MCALIDLDNSIPSTPISLIDGDDDDVFGGLGPSAKCKGEQDLIVLHEDLLDLDTPPDSTSPNDKKASSSPPSPLLSAEQALRLFEPPQCRHSPKLAPRVEAHPDSPLVEIDVAEVSHLPPPAPSRTPDSRSTLSRSSPRPPLPPGARPIGVPVQLTARASWFTPPAPSSASTASHTRQRPVDVSKKTPTHSARKTDSDLTLAQHITPTPTPPSARAPREPPTCREQAKEDEQGRTDRRDRGDFFIPRETLLVAEEFCPPIASPARDILPLPTTPQEGDSSSAPTPRYQEQRRSLTGSRARNSGPPTAALVPVPVSGAHPSPPPVTTRSESPLLPSLFSQHTPPVPPTAQQTAPRVPAARQTAPRVSATHQTPPHLPVAQQTPSPLLAEQRNLPTLLAPLRNTPPLPETQRTPPSVPQQTVPVTDQSNPPIISPRLSNQLSDTESDLTEPETGITYTFTPPRDFMEELSQEALADKAAYERYRSTPSPRSMVRTHTGMPKLEESVLQSWAAAEPSKERINAIENLLATLTMGLNRWDSQSKAGKNGRGTQSRVLRVDPFGSVAWGGSTGSRGDLDLVIIDKRLPQGYHPSLWHTDPVGTKYFDMRRAAKAKNGIYNVYYVKKKLSEIAGISDCDTVRGASVPIVKFKYQGNLECDITTNDLGGWYNSKLILAYCEQSPFVLRPLIHFLKLWAGRFNLNDPSASRGPRTFSSYCLTLMAVAYLQEVGHLPNLQQGVHAPDNLDPSNVDMPDTIWVNWGRRQGAAAHVWFRATPPRGWVPTSLSLNEAIIGFFAFLKNDFDPATDILSVLNGGVIRRSSPKGQAEEKRGMLVKEAARLSPEDREIRLRNFDLMEKTNWHYGMGTGTSGLQPLAWTRESLVVQDPFIWEKNCAGGISNASVQTFYNAVHITHLKLSRGREQSISELLR